MDGYTTTLITKYLVKSGIKCATSKYSDFSGYSLTRHERFRWQNEKYMGPEYSLVASFQFYGTKQQIESYKKIFKFIILKMGYCIVFEEVQFVHIELIHPKLSKSVIEELDSYAQIKRKELKEDDEKYKKYLGIDNDEKELKKMAYKYGFEFKPIKIPIEPKHQIDYEKFKEFTGFKKTNSNITYEKPIKIKSIPVISSVENKKIEFDGGYILEDAKSLRIMKGEKVLAYTNFDIKSKQNYGDYMFVKLFGSVIGVVDLNNISIFCKTLKEDKIVGKILLDYVKTQTKEKGSNTIICETSRQLPVRDRTKKILMDNGFRIYQTHWSSDMFVFKENYSYNQLETIKEQENGKRNWYFMHNYEEAMSWEKNSPEDYKI